MDNVTWWLALSAGFLSFISPCCLPLYPSFISYITGISIKDLNDKNSISKNKQIFFHASLFLLGFSCIFYVLGFSASWIGKIFIDYKDLIRMLGAIFIGFMGLFLLGVVKPTFLLQEHRFGFKNRGVSALNSFLVGVIFSAGWTPCIGPIFGSIMYASVMDPTKTFVNVTAYSLGFSIPFLLMAFFIGKTRFITKHSAIFMKIGGVLMVIIAVLLYTNKMTYISMLFSDLFNLPYF
ncbi:cytochrome C biogenesis protein [Bacillus thuringiensis serovar pirenaica]|uniref:cytochrome c biogenesis CcdA family protein n=3 Tax=Bacillus TaxID=1386 RepID=UPI000A38068C|nr:cytochrome c biogenesis protein CcdA [Bacillus thuringiensis]MDM5370071.1 cytochrome c biogenesis protein CcdA [Bacillus bombysepticus]MDO6634352.1 cytochrome c biogenesis protein CcdA [Bacillus thuringiensis]MDO6663623.1 cytochrome c biogenesis protein CcdA [Bacillus thuringiensis]MDO6704501.1 cytochrome c biogenesis protein CcdA [Bacillus thuringiensis]OUB25928.1 cytochrome C biogenesis protein [Bacillus thuringiensis serovar pirenaica]